MKRIGLVVAAAMLGSTGVASAGIAVHQFSLSSSTSSQSVALDAKTEDLAANCWVATGAGQAAGCNTAASSGALPGLPNLDQVTGLVNVDSLVDTAKGIAGQAVGTATSAAGAATAAAGGLPVQCDVSGRRTLVRHRHRQGPRAVAGRQRREQRRRLSRPASPVRTSA